MSEYLKEPVESAGQIGMPGHCTMAQIFDADGMSVASMDTTQDQKLATERARRIVACVNACAGIEDPQAWIDSARFYSHETVTAITKQRDELLAALKSAAAILDLDGDMWGVAARLRATIASTEGREDSECST